MNDFWAAHWLHSPPDDQAVNGRRTLLKKLCFGPAEAHVWFVTEDGRFWHEHSVLEGMQEEASLLEPVSPDELGQLLEQEISLCRRLNQETLIPLFQQELDQLQ